MILHKYSYVERSKGWEVMEENMIVDGEYQIIKLDNAGDYSMIARDTNDAKLVELWATKARRSKSPRYL